MGDARLLITTFLLFFSVLAFSQPLVQSAQAQGTVNVTINNYSFSPQNITLVIGVNNTVTWTNTQTGIPHTVTADDGSWSSASLGTGSSYTHTFATSGKFTYHCSIHTYMKGTIRVLGTGSPGSTTAGSAGGGIPEFPFGALAVGAVVILVVGSYILARQSVRMQRRAVQGP